MQTLKQIEFGIFCLLLAILVVGGLFVDAPECKPTKPDTGLLTLDQIKNKEGTPWPHKPDNKSKPSRETGRQMFAKVIRRMKGD